MRVLVAALLVCLTGTAEAQIGLPPVRVPALPPVNVPGVLTGLPGTADAATAQLDTAQLRELRHARIRELLRRHRDVLEADSPLGAAEWHLAVAVGDGDRITLYADGRRVLAATLAQGNVAAQLEVAPDAESM